MVEQKDATQTHGFVLERDEEVAELQARVLIYRHARTGARLLSVVLDDENKCFAVSLRTPPADSTGLPHILEHSVLGGSQKYPLKDPFFELVKGSLKTFLNAFTAPDRTTYPVASTNLKDFYNLVDVYLDAVFFPLLTPHHLDQEGWHYELDAADAPLKFKGVVFNEMKGAYSSPEGLLGRHGLQALLPDTPYGNDSGGDPEQIPNLTYDAFVRFHRTYYHPSNALFYFYGDDDPEQRLVILAELLEKFDVQPVDSAIPLQPPLDAPRRYSFPYGVDAGSDFSRRALISVDWLLDENNDPARTMLLRVLGYALVGTQASPLRKALLDSGLGEDAFGGLGLGLRQMSFGAGMRNIAPADAGAVEALILDTLESVAAEGLEAEMVEAALNSIEFALRENNSGGYPRGLGLMQRAMGMWNYDNDPIAPLRYESALAWVKEQLAGDARVLSNLIRNLLIENPHRVTVVLEPDPEHNARLEADEQARLTAARAAMSEADVQAVLENTAALRARQETPDAPELLAALPSLDLEDLERSNRTIPTDLGRLGADDVTLLHHDLHTNGVLYLTLGWDLGRIPQPLLPYAELFGSLLTQMGTRDEDYVKLSRRIGRKTGGVGASSFLSSVKGQSDAATWLMLAGKSSLERAGDLTAIMGDILLTARLDDRERLRQIVRKAKASMEASLVPAGSSYVDIRLRAPFSEVGWISELFDGTEWLHFLRRLLDEIENDFDGLQAKLEQVRELLIVRPGTVANVTLDAAGWESVRPHVESLLAALPTSAAPRRRWSAPSFAAHEGLTVPSQVNYVGLGADMGRLGFRYHGSINVISNQLRTDWLLQKIRVQGGAYGANMSYGRQTNVVTFTSYRDPNLLATLDVYRQTADYLRRLELTPRELTRAIIGAISSYDPYMLPDAKGSAALRRYLANESEAELQLIREQILGTTLADFKRFGELLHEALPDARTVVLGSAAAIEAANAERGGWLTVQRIL